MAASKRTDLYLQVSGNVTGLATAMKTGRSLVNEFGTSAVNVLEEVERKFGEVGKAGAPGLKEVERAYDSTFKRIRENARSVLEAPSGQAAIQIVDANATREAAEAAERKAQAFRLVAEAATRADQAQSGLNPAVRAYAVAAAAAAVEAQNESNELREQAAVLAQVEGHIESTGAAQKRAHTISGQARAGYQQLSYQLGDVATQYAAGTSASIIFAQQSSQVIQAISLITGEAKGFIGFIGGPWGIGISAALVALTPLVSQLFASEGAGEAAGRGFDAAKAGADRLTQALDRLRQAQGKVQAADLGTVEVTARQKAARVLQLEGEIAATPGTRAGAQQRVRLNAQLEAAKAERADADALLAASKMRLQNQQRLDAINDRESGKGGNGRGSTPSPRVRASVRPEPAFTFSPVSLDGLFDPSDRKDAAEQMAKGFADDFRALFGSDDPLADVLSEGDRSLAEMVTRWNETARAEQDRPIARYREQLERDVGDINLAMENVGARGLRALEDGLVGVLSGTESVADAFTRMATSIVSDLIRIQIQRLILNSIGGAGGFLGALGLKDGGRVSIAGFADGGLPGYAGGGIPYRDPSNIIRGPGDGRSDSILALVDGVKPIRVSNGEAIVNERGVRKHWALIDAINKDRLPAFADGGVLSSMPALPSVARAANDLAPAAGMGGPVTVRVALTDDLHATIDNRAAGVAVQVVRQAAPDLIDAARAATAASLTRPTL